MRRAIRVLATSEYGSYMLDIINIFQLHDFLNKLRMICAKCFSQVFGRQIPVNVEEYAVFTFLAARYRVCRRMPPEGITEEETSIK